MVDLPDPMPPVIPTFSIKIYFVIADELEKTNSFSTLIFVFPSMLRFNSIFS